MMWKNMGQTDRQTSWVTKATNTNSEYGTLVAFPRQKWLRENTSILRYTHMACLVYVQYRVIMQKIIKMVFKWPFYMSRHWYI